MRSGNDSNQPPAGPNCEKRCTRSRETAQAELDNQRLVSSLTMC